MSNVGKILLVDDEVAIRNVYQLYLETSGYKVITASSVAEALRILKGGGISLVILDVFLHEENGLELLKGIMAAGLNIPVIVISAVTRDHPAFEEALQSGAAAVYTKTLPLTHLLAEIRRLLPVP